MGSTGIAVGAVIGAAVGLALGRSYRRTGKSCKFCGYQEDQTQELFATEELNKLLEDE